MKKLIQLLCLLAASVASLHADGWNDPEWDDLSLTLSTGYATEYFHRATKQSRHTIQAKGEMAYPIHDLADVYAGFWSNNPLTENFASEIDLYAGMNYMFYDGFTFDFGYTHYRYRAGTNLYNKTKTNEIYIGLASDVIFNPAVYFYYNFELKAVVLDFSAGYKFNLAEVFNSNNNTLNRLYVDTGVSAGWYRSTQFQDNDPRNATVNYAFFTLQSDLIFMINDHANVKTGIRYAVNSESKDNPANDFGGPSMVAWTTAFTLGF